MLRWQEDKGRYLVGYSTPALLYFLVELDYAMLERDRSLTHA